MRTHIKEKSKPALLDRCEGGSPMTGEFPTQSAGNEETASISWGHHAGVTSFCTNLSILYGT